MKRYEVLIELADGNMAVMDRTNDLGAAQSYAEQLRASGKYRRNLIKVLDRDAPVPKPRNESVSA